MTPATGLDNPLVEREGLPLEPQPALSLAGFAASGERRARGRKRWASILEAADLC